MENLILLLIILLIVSLNVMAFHFYKNGKMNLVLSGIIVMILAPVLGFISGASFLHFYDWSSGGTGEGAGFGGAFIGLITLANGILITVIGMLKWVLIDRKISR